MAVSVPYHHERGQCSAVLNANNSTRLHTIYATTYQVFSSRFITNDILFSLYWITRLYKTLQLKRPLFTETGVTIPICLHYFALKNPVADNGIVHLVALINFFFRGSYFVHGVNFLTLFSINVQIITYLNRQRKQLKRWVYFVLHLVADVSRLR